MFCVHFSRKKFIINQQCSSLLWHFNKLFIASISSLAEHNFNPADKNEFIRYEFPKCDKIKDLVNSKQKVFESSFSIIPNIITVDQEIQLVDEIEKLLKRVRYQHDHWDDAIHGYRETEITTWKDPNNSNLVQELKNRVFANGSVTKPMQRVHILDLCENGYVKPHIDSIRFCGNIIAGLSLLSDSVMRLADEKHSEMYAVYALLPRRSLYIMKDDVRYQYTHEILSDGAPSVFINKEIVRQRRVSIVMRNEPPVDSV